jgi:hypothetical protein
MAKAVLTKVSPTCDDLPMFGYHFPGTYLDQARSLPLPARPEWQPRPQFLKHHREKTFKD